MKIMKPFYLIALIICIALSYTDALAKDGADITTSVATYTPNMHAKSLTTPVAWGASDNVLFIGAGGSYPSSYSSSADGAVEMGYGIGNPKKIGMQVMVASLDTDGWNAYSLYAHAFRELSDVSAIGMGVESISLTKKGDTGKSFYIVYSVGVQDSHFVNKDNGHSLLYYSIGVGTGRFGINSPEDIFYGKSKHGSYAFGSIAYEVADVFNVISDWNGLNLNVGVSKTFWLTKSIPVSVILGAADLTNYSGDRVRGIIGVGSAVKL